MLYSFMDTVIQSTWIENHIFKIRNQRVMLSMHLAKLYSVEPKVLIQSVKRNIERFPKDFMFLLEYQEFKNLKSQFVTSSWGGLRTPPYAFTEQGIAMLSAVLHSRQAIHVNIEIMRAFVQLRKSTAVNNGILGKLNLLEKKYDHQFNVVFEAIRKIITPPDYPKRKIGIHNDESE